MLKNKVSCARVLFMAQSYRWLKFLVIFVIMKWSCSIVSLTLIWLGFLGIRFEVGSGHIPSRLCLKLVRIMLETSNLARKYTRICSFRKFTFSYQNCLNFADASIFLQKKQCLLAKIVSFVKTKVWESCVRDILVLFFSFCKIKGYY